MEGTALLTSAYLPFDPDGRVAGEQFAARPGERSGGVWARPGSSGDRASRGRSADVRQLGRRTVDKHDGTCLMTARCASATNHVTPGTASVISPTRTQVAVR